MAIAIINPPMKRNINGFAYGAVVFPIGAIPITGNKTIGRSAVAAIGIDSVIHSTAINTATAAVFHATSFNPSGAGMISKTIKRATPT